MTVLISGGFDPLHDGHIDLIELAVAHGDIIVALNTDKWLLDKKGYVFMPWDVRSRVLRAIVGVVAVIPTESEDGTVCHILEELKPKFFVNGGDRMEPNEHEDSVCKRLDIVQIFGGQKRSSSGDLVFSCYEQLKKIHG